MDSSVLTPDYVPPEWSSATGSCTCETPLPETRATNKGAARTYCARCGLPLRIAFERR